MALRNKPEERNPYEIPGYVKSLYFCFLHMKSRSLFNKTYWKNYAEDFNIKKLLNTIEASDKKVADRQRLGEVAKQKKKDNNPNNSNTTQQKRSTNNDTPRVKITKPKSPIAAITPKTSLNKKSTIRTIKKK